MAEEGEEMDGHWNSWKLSTLKSSHEEEVGNALFTCRMAAGAEREWEMGRGGRKDRTLYVYRRWKEMRQCCTCAGWWWSGAR